MAWALPAMFTQERMHTLQHEDVGRHDVVTYTAWQRTTGFSGANDDYDSDPSSDDSRGNPDPVTESGSISSRDSRDWNTAPVGEPDAEGEPLPAACRPRPKANPAVLRLAAAAEQWVQGNPSRTPSPAGADPWSGVDLPEPECEVEDVRPDGRSEGERALAAYEGFSVGGVAYQR